jgi:uncharacterized protein DUF6023
MSERVRGVVLYATAAVLLAAGVTWWFRAAPHQPRYPTIEQWQASAQRLLPDVAEQEGADTIALSAGADHEVVADVGSAEYEVAFVCVGGDDSQVRVTLGQIGDDSGRGMACTGEPHPDGFSVTTAGQLRMNVSVGAAGPVVFRYTVLRADD